MTFRTSGLVARTIPAALRETFVADDTVLLSCAGVCSEGAACSVRERGGHHTQGLKRICGQGHLHFITFRCCRGLPILRCARSTDPRQDRNSPTLRHRALGTLKVKIKTWATR